MKKIENLDLDSGKIVFSSDEENFAAQKEKDYLDKLAQSQKNEYAREIFQADIFSEIEENKKRKRSFWVGLKKALGF